MGQCCGSPVQRPAEDLSEPQAAELARTSSSAVHRARAEAALAEVEALRAHLAELEGSTGDPQPQAQAQPPERKDESQLATPESTPPENHADDSEPWTADLHESLAAASAGLAKARDIAAQSAELFVANTTVDETSGKDSTATAADMQEIRTLFDRCVQELSQTRRQQGDTFPAVFERVKIALKLWSSIPNDPSTNPEWNMCPDRGISDRLIEACGPPFKVVWWRVLKTLGYIPRSNQSNDIVVVKIYQAKLEGDDSWSEVDEAKYYNIDSTRRRIREIKCKVRMSLDEANAAVLQAGLKGVSALDSPTGPRAFCAGDLVVYTYFFSHRWLRGAEDPPNPDGYYHLKAQALVELGGKESSGYEYFYWIDFTCIDQERWPRGNPAAGVAMLPLYTANCNSLVMYDHCEYEERGWTRAERLVYCAFNMPVFDVLNPLAGTLSKNYTNPDGRQETRKLLADPSAGSLTNPEADGPLIEQLQQLAVAEWANSWRGTWNKHYYGTVRAMKGIERLEFGVTEVQMYDATPGSQKSGM